MIEVRCPDCRYLLKCGDDLAGKTVPCPDCKTRVTVPRINDGIEVVDSAPPRRPAPRNRPAGDPGFEVVTNDNEHRERRRDESQTKAASRRAQLVVAVDGPVDDADVGEYLPKRHLKKRRRPSSPFDGNAYMYVLLGGIGVGLLFALLALVNTALGLFGMLAGILLMLIGAVWGIIIPFHEDVSCGLMYLFVPFYSLYYLITRWEVCRRPFGMAFAGWGVLLIAAICTGIFADDNRLPRAVPGPPRHMQPDWPRHRFGKPRLDVVGIALGVQVSQSICNSARP